MTSTFRDQVNALIESGVNPRMSDTMLASLATMPSTPREVTAEPHTGQHLQGCVSCYEAVTPSSPVCPVHGPECEAWS